MDPDHLPTMSGVQEWIAPRKNADMYPWFSTPVTLLLVHSGMYHAYINIFTLAMQFTTEISRVLCLPTCSIPSSNLPEFETPEYNDSCFPYHLQNRQVVEET